MTLRNIDDVTRDAMDHYVFPLVKRTDLQAGEAIIFQSGQGIELTDIQGRAYLDMMSTNTRASSLGFANERIAKAMYDQMMELHYAGTFSHVASTTVQLATKIADIAPGPLTMTSFGSSGSEANENSFKFAREYHLHKGDKPHARKIISLWHAYHGATMGAIGATDYLGTRNIAEPGVPGHTRIPAPTLYRTPFGMDPSEVSEFCADYLEQHILHEGPEYVAAFIAEPVRQGDGVQVPPDDYFKRVREVCDRYDVLFIADEVITGFGRTGTWFAMEHWGVEADIMSMGKAMSAGYAPLSGSIVTDRVADVLPVFSHIQTYQGHPTACAASLAAVAQIEEENLLAAVRDNGKYFLDQMQRLRDLAIVGDVRGLGFWTCIDFSTDKTTKAQFADDTVKCITRRMAENGILGSQEGPSAIEFAPAYITTREQIDRCVDVAEAAIRAEMKERGLG